MPGSAGVSPACRNGPLRQDARQDASAPKAVMQRSGAFVQSAIARPPPPAYFSRVKLSVKSDYAARALLGLARHYHTGQAVKLDVLAEAYSVPPNYLVQILIELKAQHL